MIDWKTSYLKDLCNKIDYGYTASAINSNDGIKFLRITDIVPDEINWDNVPTCSISDKDTSKYLLEDGDIVIARTGATTGFAKQFQKKSPKSVFASYLVRLKLNHSVNKVFIGKIVESDNYKKFIQTNISGSAQPQANAKVLSSYQVKLPPISIQQKIASILSAYDDLIENNNKRIKVLEEIGKNLFLQLTKKISRDEIELSEILKLKSGYAFKSKDFNKEKTNNIVVRMGNFPPGGGLQFEDNMMYLSNVGPEKYLLTDGDLVMVLSDVTRDGRIIGNVGFIPKDNENNYYLNQRVSKIESEKENLFFLYELFNSSKFKSYCLSRANSATVLNLSNVHIYSYKVGMPSKKELSYFNKSIEPVINLIQNLIKKNKILKKTKNLLLPKLISGELDVEGLDIKIRPEIL